MRLHADARGHHLARRRSEPAGMRAGRARRHALVLRRSRRRHPHRRRRAAERHRQDRRRAQRLRARARRQRPHRQYRGRQALSPPSATAGTRSCSTASPASRWAAVNFVYRDGERIWVTISTRTDAAPRGGGAGDPRRLCPAARERQGAARGGRLLLHQRGAHRSRATHLYVAETGKGRVVRLPLAADGTLGPTRDLRSRSALSWRAHRRHSPSTQRAIFG